MAERRHPSRRAVLAAGLRGSALLPFVLATPRAVATAPGPRPAAPDAGLLAIGRAVRREHPHLVDRAGLPAAVAARLREGDVVAALVEAGPAIGRDFDTDELVVVQRLILSRTEAALCAQLVRQEDDR